MTSLVPFAIDFSSVLTIAADVFILFLFVLLLTPLQDRGWGKKAASWLGRFAIPFSFAIGAASVIGSLFF